LARDLIAIDVLRDWFAVGESFEVVRHVVNPVFLRGQCLADKGIDVVANGSDGVLEMHTVWELRM
jgi:hypothetical protein